MGRNALYLYQQQILSVDSIVVFSVSTWIHNLWTCSLLNVLLLTVILSKRKVKAKSSAYSTYLSKTWLHDQILLVAMMRKTFAVMMVYVCLCIFVCIGVCVCQFVSVTLRLVTWPLKKCCPKSSHTWYVGLSYWGEPYCFWWRSEVIWGHQRLYT